MENNNSAWQREMIQKKTLNQVETPIFGKVRERIPEANQGDTVINKNNYLTDEKQFISLNFRKDAPVFMNNNKFAQ